MCRTRSTLCIAALVTLLPVAAGAQAPSAEDDAADENTAATRKYAVMPFSVARGIDAEATQLLDEVLLTELSKRASAGDVFIGASDITAILGLEQQRQMLDCGDESCMAEIGNALGVDYLVTSSLGRLGDDFIINVKVLNPKEVKVVRRESLTVSGGEGELAAAVRGLAPVILGQAVSTASVEDATATSPETASAATVDEEAGGGLSGLGWAGIAAAGIGGALLIGSGVGVGLADATLADATSHGDDKASAETIYGAGLFGLGLGATLILAGASVAAFLD